MEPDLKDRINTKAYELHKLGGPSHMYDRSYTGPIYNPMLIFPNQCGCLKKAEEQIQAELVEEARQREVQHQKEQEYFLNLFEPRAE